VLTQVKKLSTGRGVLVVEMMSKSYAENNLTKKKYSMVGKMLRLEESSFDKKASRLRSSGDCIGYADLTLSTSAPSVSTTGCTVIGSL